MCGILGYSGRDKNTKKIKESLSRLSNRGPDEQGIFEEDNIFLGHTRLSIIDLSQGKQPMISNCSRYIIVFNGEIYNYKKLKSKYKYDYMTQSDTEVLLAGYINHGYKFLKDLEGMFSFCIYDKKLAKLFLARDQFGIKPLLYHYDKNSFAFSSELKGLIPGIIPKQSLNKTAVQDFFIRKFIPSPTTIYQDVKKLQPGNYLEYDLNNFKLKIHSYFDINNYNSHETNLNAIKSNIQKSIKKHLISDVSVSCFLSGGIDSTIIAYEAQKHLKKMPTYTVGFKDSMDHEDIKYSRIAANFIKSDHHEIIVDKINIDEFINLIEYFDEPFADTAILANYIVSKEVSKTSKVALSGDGADEFFYGYRAYNEIHTKSKNSLLKINNNFMSKNIFLKNRVKQMVEHLDSDINSIYQSNYYNMPSYCLNQIFNSSLKKISFNEFDSCSKEILRGYDLRVNLPDYYLTKVDKVSMMNSLEVRVPFIDIDIFKSLPSSSDSFYDKKSVGKHILKEIYKGKIPNEILDRRKQGFIRNWRSLLVNHDFENYLDKFITSEFISRFELNLNFIKYCKTAKNSMSENILWRIFILSVWFKKNKDNII